MVLVELFLNLLCFKPPTKSRSVDDMNKNEKNLKKKKTKVLLKHSHNILSVWCFKTLSSAFTWIYNVYEKLFKSINSLITQTWTNFIVGNLFHKNSIIWKTKKYQDHNKNLTKQALWNHFKIVPNRRFCTIYHSLKIFTTRNKNIQHNTNE